MWFCAVTVWRACEDVNTRCNNRLGNVSSLLVNSFFFSSFEFSRFVNLWRLPIWFTREFRHCLHCSVSGTRSRPAVVWGGGQLRWPFRSHMKTYLRVHGISSLARDGRFDGPARRRPFICGQTLNLNNLTTPCHDHRYIIHIALGVWHAQNRICT